MRSINKDLLERFTSRVFDRLMTMVAAEAPAVPEGERLVLRVELRTTKAAFEMKVTELGEDGIVFASRQEFACLGIDGSNPLLSMKLADLPGIPLRAVNQLTRIIEDVGDLAQMTQSDLLKQRSLGKKTLAGVVKALAAVGLTPGMRVLRRGGSARSTLDSFRFHT